MGNWSLVGILFMFGVFFALTAFILSQINVTNPLSGEETSILATIIGWIVP